MGLDKLRGTSGARRSLQLGNRAEGADRRLALARLRPHLEESCVITETRHHTLGGLAHSAWAVATSSWHWVQTWNDPRGMPNSDKISADIRLCSPRGGKGFPARNQRVFKQRHMVLGFHFFFF